MQIDQVTLQDDALRGPAPAKAIRVLLLVGETGPFEPANARRAVRARSSIEEGFEGRHYLTRDGRNLLEAVDH